MDLKLKKDGWGLDISPGLHENKLWTLEEIKYEQKSQIKVQYKCEINMEY